MEKARLAQLDLRGDESAGYGGRLLSDLPLGTFSEIRKIGAKGTGKAIERGFGSRGMVQYKRFFQISLVWYWVGVYLLSFDLRFLTPAMWFTVFFLLSLADLYSLSKVLEYLFLHASGGSRPGARLKLIFWSIFKFLCLGSFGFVLYAAPTISRAAVFLGAGTLVIVPLLGGFWWSRRDHGEISHA